MKEKNPTAPPPVDQKKPQLETWENEGGEIPNVSKPVKDADQATLVAGKKARSVNP